MAIVSDVEIRLRADIARLQQDLTAARRSVDTAMDGVKKSVDFAQKAFAALGVGIGIKELVTQVIDAQREFDKLNASLVTATGSTANAAQAFGALQKFASQTPYSVAEATEAFIKLRNLGLNPGEKALTSYGNTAASMGKSLNQLIEAVADAATGEFERLKEFGIKAKQNGDLVNFTFQGTTKTVGNNAKEIQKYLIDIGNVNFAGAMEKRLNTLDGAISNLGDAWQSTLRAVASGGFGEGVQAGVLALSNALSDLGDIFKAVGGEATSEGGKVQEAAGLHMALTTVFKGIAIVGVGLVAAFREIGSELGALGAIATLVAKGDLAGVKTVLAARAQDAKSIDDWLKGKIAAIQGSVEAGNKARDVEAANIKKNGGEALGQYELVLTAEQARDKALADSLDIRNKLDGTDAQAAGNLKKLKAAYDTGAISLADYNRYVAQANKETTMASTAYKNGQKSLDAQAESIKRATEAQSLLNQERQSEIDFLKQSGQLSDKDALTQTADAQIADLRNQITAQNELMAIAKKRYDSQKDQAEIIGTIGKLNTQINARQKKEEQDLFLLEQGRYKLAVDNTADLIEAAQAESKTQREATRDQQDELDMLGMTSKQIAEVTASRLRDRAGILDQRAAVQELTDATGELALQSRTQAEELRKQADIGIYKDQLQQAQKYWGDVDQIAHDTFVSIGDGGKDAFTRLKDSAKNIFFDWLYQMTLKKWIISIGTATDGAAAVAGLSTGSSSTLDIAGSANNIYKAINGGFNSLSTSVADAVQAGFNKSGLAGKFDSLAPNVDLASGVTSNSGVASYLGQGASMLGTYAIGSSLNSLISGGYKTGSGFMTAEKVATAVASYFGPLAGSITGAISGAVNRLFGMQAKQYSDSSTLQGTLGSGSFSGNISTAYTQKGGLFRSDKSGTDSSAVDAVTVTTLSNAYDALKVASSGYAKALGIDATAIASRTDKLTVTLGKDAAANQKAIEDYFTGIADSMATQLLPTLAKFKQEGETAATTLQRVATDFVAVDAVLAAMGTDSQTAFKAVGAASIDARERLIALAGGLSALVSQTQYYNDNFLTDAQKIAPIQKQVNDQLAAMGLAGITTTEQFAAAVNNLVSSGALATESGAKQYETLLALAPQYKQVADYLGDAAKTTAEAATTLAGQRTDLQIQLITEQGNAAGALSMQREKELAAMDASLRPIQQRIYALQDEKTATEALKTKAGTTMDTLKRAVDAQKGMVESQFTELTAALTASIDAMTKKVSDLQSLSDTLKSTNLPGTTMDRATAQAQIAGALAIARAGGVLPKADDIKDALSVLSGSVDGQFSSLVDQQRDALLTANNVEALSGITDTQLSVAQQTLISLNDQKTQAQRDHDEQIAALTDIADRAQAQLDAINGIDTTVLDVATAFASFAAAIQTALGNKGISAQATVSPENQIEALYQSLLGRVSDAGGLRYYADRLATGTTSVANIAADIKNSAEYQASHPPVVADPTQYGTMSKTSTDQAAINATMQTTMNRTASAVEQLASQFNAVSGGGNTLITQAA